MSRTWLITGVSSGFGNEMTKQLLEKGDTVIGTVRNTNKVEDLIKKYPDTFDCQILDVTDIERIHSFIPEMFEKHGRIDVVVNNAGYGLFGAAARAAESESEREHYILTRAGLQSLDGVSEMLYHFYWFIM